MPQPLLKRRLDSQKGDYGHVLMLAGSARYTGAACLAACAAMRAGAGLVTLGIPKSLHPIFARKLTEAMFLPLPETRHQVLSKAGLPAIKDFLKKVDCLLIGPGLSRETPTQWLVRAVLTIVRAPLVLDADGLNALVGHLELLKRIKTTAVLTPHPGEMGRLLGISVAQVQRNRKRIAKDFALRYNVNLVLKGHDTIVASSRGKVAVNATGNPGMATAGSGDVLAGILVAFLGQGVGAFEAARSAVYLHGLAGDLAARDKTQTSLIASDIVEYLPKAFEKAGAH
ncbi:MAG: NAD(P)H-hydrate dehydratase [Candidatus Omnitrophota bacterium]